MIWDFNGESRKEFEPLLEKLAESIDVSSTRESTVMAIVAKTNSSIPVQDSDTGWAPPYSPM
jgi:hypothetical protein